MVVQHASTAEMYTYPSRAVDWDEPSGTLTITRTPVAAFTRGVCSGRIIDAKYHLKKEMEPDIEDGTAVWYVPSKKRFDGKFWARLVARTEPECPPAQRTVVMFRLAGRTLTLPEAQFLAPIIAAAHERMGLTWRAPGIWEYAPSARKVWHGRAYAFANQHFHPVNDFAHFLWVLTRRYVTRPFTERERELLLALYRDGAFAAQLTSDVAGALQTLAR